MYALEVVSLSNVEIWKLCFFFVLYSCQVKGQKSEDPGSEVDCTLRWVVRLLCASAGVGTYEGNAKGRAKAS